VEDGEKGERKEETEAIELLETGPPKKKRKCLKNGTHFAKGKKAKTTWGEGGKLTGHNKFEGGEPGPKGRLNQESDL